jgi:hypothetical protein
MNYAYFIKNLPDDLIPLINSFVEPETDYYLTILKERVRKFSKGGLYRISPVGLGVRGNQSYFNSDKQILKDEQKDTINLTENIKKIITVKNVIKKLYKPMVRKTLWTYKIKETLGQQIPNIKDGEIILALLLLGVKYKIKELNLQSFLLIDFYCKKK